MVMELLGPSLQDELVENGQGLSEQTVMLLGEQLVERLEYIHGKVIYIEMSNQKTS